MIHAAVYKRDNKQGLIVQHRELDSNLVTIYNRNESEKNRYICMYN